MAEQRDLLVEIGTEELPPKALKKLSEAFAAGIVDGLKAAALAPAEAQVFASPRRLAALLRGVPEAQADRQTQRRGPALQAAFDAAGKPSKAAEGFARSCASSVDQLDRLETDKGAWLVFNSVQPGKPTVELLEDIIAASLDKLPIPKRMRWADRDEQFVRPVHWAAVVFGSETVPCRLIGLTAGNATRGHRFHAPQALTIREAGEYAARLRDDGKVIAGFAERRAEIERQVLSEAERLGGTAIVDEALLDEVTALVEWPVAVSGGFEDKFLDVPAEALILTMQDNQKYFALRDAEGELMPAFITIANIDSAEPDKVREGNERVVRPRLADAMFFWTQDLKKTLDSRRDSLAAVTFQARLGSQLEKSDRVTALARLVAAQIGADESLAERAGQLAKCDLMSEMVYEFPELQGTMGEYYAVHDGEHPEVARALFEQYLPRGAGDQLPQTGAGRALALAERIDTLVGIFAIGMKPTGAKDPFALRRAALGLLRIAIEGELDVEIGELLTEAGLQIQTRLQAGGEAVQMGAALAELWTFCQERLRGYYAEQGVSPQIFDAVLALHNTRPRDFDRRIHAVRAFVELPEAEALSAANKRIRNILKKVEGELPESVDVALFSEAEERALLESVNALAAEVEPLFAAGDYRAALTALAALRAPVDAYFDAVMVMADDPAVRNNRIALLSRVGALCSQVADLSRLQG